jgi:Replication initiator protein A
MVIRNKSLPAETRSPLLPERRDQGDFFVCDIFNAAPKGDMAAMEHPIFSLSTKPSIKARRYENGKHWIAVTPSIMGMATVHDRDILIYCISQIMSALNEGRQVHRTVRFKAYDLLVATNRQTNGQAYQGLKSAFERLRGTTIETNVTTNDFEVLDGFGLIERYRIVRETREGRMLDIEITLSDWVFNAIQAKEVLTLHRDYFRLRKPLERRMYELARKHCGAQKSWKISLNKLDKKTGSSSSVKEFRRLVGAITKQDELHSHMPDYSVRLDAEDMVEFVNRRSDMALNGTQIVQPSLGSAAANLPLQSRRPLNPDTFAQARQVAPGWDIYYLENAWRSWMREQPTPAPRNPDAAFIGFCKSWFEKRGRP